MLKIVDSARIKHNMPTRPRHSAESGISCCGMVMVVVANRILLYSYFQSGSSGCFRSHSGRRLFTAGRVAKLYSGGGELVDHSRVHASQGSLLASLPLKNDQSRLAANARMPIA